MTGDNGADAFAANKNWGLNMQRSFADPVYDSYFRTGTVHPVDVESDTSDAALAVDQSGVDKVVHTDTGPIHLAQRIRTRKLIDPGRGIVLEPDFSLRESKNDEPAEYRRLLDAWRSDGNIPAVYAFGIGRGTSKNQCLQRGLKRMIFVDTRQLMRAIDKSRLSPTAVNDVQPGVRARFYDIDRLRDVGAVRDEVQYPTIKAAWDDDRDIDRRFPRWRQPDSGRPADASIFDYS